MSVTFVTGLSVSWSTPEYLSRHFMLFCYSSVVLLVKFVIVEPLCLWHFSS